LSTAGCPDQLDEMTPAAPALAEAIMVERDIRLVELTGARYHFGQISTRAALDAITAAKARGLVAAAGGFEGGEVFVAQCPAGAAALGQF